MRSIARRLASALVLTVIAAAPALAQTVTIDYDHSINFLKFKTFTWQKLHATDPSVENRINSALKRTMQGRYMTEVGSGGDVLITAVAATQDKAEFATFYNSLADLSWQNAPDVTGFLAAGSTPQDVPLNTLIIDMYDPHTHKLLWRGAITLPAADATSKEADQKFDKAVTELISKYPPKYKKP